MHEPFGRYGLLQRLATGGMAEIFLAQLHGDEGFAKKVVIKRILPHLGRDADFVRMFIDEAMVASQLTHPNIIEVHDFGHAEGSYFMAMDYVDGLDLHHVLRATKRLGIRLSAAEILAIGERVARGLAYTHSLADDAGVPLGIVHRDVSPHNIMVSRTGAVKVMDFGIAKAAARATSTASGAIKGKLSYLSPEQARGESASSLSDQFALGLVLWECLTGHKLFEGESDVAVLAQVAQCRVPNLEALSLDAPKALTAIVQRMLSCAPSDRYADLDEVADALTAVRYSLGAAGIVKLDAVVEQCSARGETTAAWSYAEQMGLRAAGGTRVLPQHRRSTTPVTPTVPTRKNRRLAAALELHRTHTTSRRHLLRARPHGSGRRLRAAHFDRLPWLLVGALLAMLLAMVGKHAQHPFGATMAPIIKSLKGSSASMTELQRY